MKRAGLPTPIVILALTALLSLVSAFGGRAQRSDSAERLDPAVQTVEGQQAAAIYFRVMSWLSRFVPNEKAPAAAAPAVSAATEASQSTAVSGRAAQPQPCAGSTGGHSLRANRTLSRAKTGPGGAAKQARARGVRAMIARLGCPAPSAF
jgi:hypothetical protein